MITMFIVNVATIPISHDNADENGPDILYKGVLFCMETSKHPVR